MYTFGSCSPETESGLISRPEPFSPARRRCLDHPESRERGAGLHQSPGVFRSAHQEEDQKRDGWTSSDTRRKSSDHRKKASPEEEGYHDWKYPGVPESRKGTIHQKMKGKAVRQSHLLIPLPESLYLDGFSWSISSWSIMRYGRYDLFLCIMAIL